MANAPGIASPPVARRAGTSLSSLSFGTTVNVFTPAWATSAQPSLSTGSTHPCLVSTESGQGHALGTRVGMSAGHPLSCKLLEEYSIPSARCAHGIPTSYRQQAVGDGREPPVGAEIAIALRATSRR